MKKIKEEIALIVGSFITYAILITFLHIDRKNKEYIYSLGKIDQIESEFLVISERFENLSEFFTNSRLRKPDITTTLATEDVSKRYIIFNGIYEDFKLLKNYGYDDIIFILPDGILFLDMKKPQISGKKFIDIDNIVVVSNTLKNSVDKRFYDSMIYSYPLFHNNNLVSYVYFTVPFYTVGKNLSDIFRNFYVFYIHRDFISLNGSKGYIQSELSDEYFVDRKFYNLSLKKKEENIDIITKINIELKSKISERLQKIDSFCVPVKIENKPYIVTFYSIKDISDRHIGYLVSYTLDNTFFEFERTFYITAGLLGIIVILITYSVYQILKLKAAAEEKAITDKLTGTFNRMAIEPIINAELGTQLISR